MCFICINSALNKTSLPLQIIPGTVRQRALSITKHIGLLSLPCQNNITYKVDTTTGDLYVLKKVVLAKYIRSSVRRIKMQSNREIIEIDGALLEGVNLPILS